VSGGEAISAPKSELRFATSLTATMTTAEIAILITKKSPEAT
jgi:hypothetical protein